MGGTSLSQRFPPARQATGGRPGSGGFSGRGQCTLQMRSSRFAVARWIRSSV